MIKRFTLVILFCFLSLFYVYPITSGLILLPLDLLISNYGPWHLANVILLKNPYMQDSIIQMYPWKHLAGESVMHGIIPLWNPYQLLGMPFMAGLKPMVFYPFTWIYGLGEITTWHILLVSQLFLSLVFTYLLYRAFERSKAASILASVAFAFNSLLISILELGSEGHVILWLPCLFYCAKKFIDTKKTRFLLFLSLGVAMSILAGQLQYTAYFLLSLAGFIIVYTFRAKNKYSFYLFLGIAVLLGGGLSAVQLIPAIEFFSNSFRGLAHSYGVFAAGLMPPYHIFRLLAPDLFGNPVTHDLNIGYIEHSGYFGIIPLFFAIYAMFTLRKNNVVNYFVGLMAIAWIFSMNGGAQILYYSKIPLITSGSAERIFILVLFAGAVLSSFGFDAFLEATGKVRLWAVLGFTSISALILTIFVLLNKKGIMPGSSFQNVKFPLMIIGLFALLTVGYLMLQKKYRWLRLLFIIGIIALSYFDLFRMGYRFLTFSNKKFFYPQVPVVSFLQKDSSMSLARNYGLVEPEVATYFGLYTTETYNPLYPKRTGDALHALQGKKDPLPVNKYYLDPSAKRFKETLDFLGVSRIVAKKDVNPALEYFHSGKYEKDLKPIWHDDEFTVFENTTSYPRFGLYYAYDVVKDDKKILTLLGNGYDFRKKVVLEEQLPRPLSSGKGTTKLVQSSLNTETFFAETTKPALFYISDNFFKGWNVTVNGKKAKLYRANYTFRAVLLPEGKSMIAFRYEPLSFTLGWIISLLSIGGLVLLGIGHKKFTTKN